MKLAAETHEHDLAEIGGENRSPSAIGTRHMGRARWRDRDFSNVKKRKGSKGGPLLRTRHRSKRERKGRRPSAISVQG